MQRTLPLTDTFKCCITSFFLKVHFYYHPHSPLNETNLETNIFHSVTNLIKNQSHFNGRKHTTMIQVLN